MPHTSRPADAFGPILVNVARRWRWVLDQQLGAAGLSDATWGPLFHLGQAKASLTQKELAGVVGIDGSTLVRLLDALETQALVERHDDPADRRAWRLVITPAGRQLVAQIRRALRAPEAQMLEGLSPAEVAAMVAGLEKVQANALRLQAQRGAADGR